MTPGSLQSQFVLVLAMVLAFVTGASLHAQSEASSNPAAQSFADAVDLTPLYGVAVHSDGRLKSFESYARGMMRFVSGPQAGRLYGRSAGYTYFDMMFRPMSYEDADVIHVKKKPIRVQIADALQASLADQLSRNASVPSEQKQHLQQTLSARMNRFIEDGLISPAMLVDPQVQEVVTRLRRDLIRTAKFASALDSAMTVIQPDVLSANLRFVPPASGSTDDRWHTIPELQQMADGHDPQATSQLVDAWTTLGASWRNGDANGVNQSIATIAQVVPTMSADLYPSTSRLELESWYFRMYNLTWIWVFYALCLVPLLLSVVFRWPNARRIGMAMFIFAFLMHTFATGLRWYVSGRWPNANMFEAVTTAAWFGGAAAIFFEIIARKHAMRSLFAIASAASSMVALMCAWYMPLQLDPTISNKMPVLHDVWLYIHTNVIIFSYCLIFMAAVTATLYLLWRGWGAFMGLSLRDEFARMGGTGMLMMKGSDGSAGLASPKTSIGQVLDGMTMILMELSFIMLWAGLVMGAIWADHSWGRPWGWDPKEVFALNTFIVFAVLVHVRIKTKDKGMWTALLALIGAAVMLFNWIAINFVITGLHSYA